MRRIYIKDFFLSYAFFKSYSHFLLHEGGHRRRLSRRLNLRPVVALVGKQRASAAGAGHPAVSAGHRRHVGRRRVVHREVARLLLRLRRWSWRNFTPTASGAGGCSAVDGLQTG